MVLVALLSILWYMFNYLVNAKFLCLWVLQQSLKKSHWTRLQRLAESTVYGKPQKTNPARRSPFTQRISSLDRGHTVPALQLKHRQKHTKDLFCGEAVELLLSFLGLKARTSEA